MAETTISLGISHTPWVPERVESLRKLESGLRVFVTDLEARQITSDVIAKLFADKALNHEWSEEMWTWAAGTDATHHLFLQDDITVSPNFWPALRAMMGAVHSEIICLQAPHPAARKLSVSGTHWMGTCDGLVGVGYVVPHEILVEFLQWRGQLKAGAVEAIEEDQLWNVFSMATGRHIVHPIPTIIDHDTSVPSTYGHENHTHRKSPVLWSDESYWKLSDLENPAWWGRDVPIVGRFYNDTHRKVGRWVSEVSLDWYMAAERGCPGHGRRCR